MLGQDRVVLQRPARAALEVSWSSGFSRKQIAASQLIRMKTRSRHLHHNPPRDGPLILLTEKVYHLIFPQTPVMVLAHDDRGRTSQPGFPHSSKGGCDQAAWGPARLRKFTRCAAKYDISFFKLKASAAQRHSVSTSSLPRSRN